MQINTYLPPREQCKSKKGQGQLDKPMFTEITYKNMDISKAAIPPESPLGNSGIGRSIAS